MRKTKVLITVKTYPTISTKYDWIELDLVKNTGDFRPESFKPSDMDNEIKLLDHWDTGKDKDRAARKDIALKKVYEDMEDLISEAKDENKRTSLATFKPTEILNFYVEPVDREWDEKKKASLNQLKLFSYFNEDENFQVVKKLPYRFKYKFKDVKGKESNLMIEDWEVGQLYWKQLAKYDGDEEKALEDVRKKYFDHFVNDCELYFFLGTSKAYHCIAPNPFMIIGAFYPKKSIQGTLF